MLLLHLVFQFHVILLKESFVSAQYRNEDNCIVKSDGSKVCTTTIPQNKNEPFDKSKCNIFMAESSIPNAGFGLFTLRAMPKRYLVRPSDIVIQLINPTTSFELNSNLYNITSMKIFMRDYLWDSAETGGGQYEARNVLSVWPGYGMVANSHPKKHNVLIYRADVDEADLGRTSEAGAGAISHYHNLTIFSSKDIVAGGEILARYGDDWFNVRKDIVYTGDKELKHDPEWLVKHGICMDNLSVGPSKVSEAGRGAFANRYFTEGTHITSSTLAALHRDAMTWTDDKYKKRGVQLLLNYCYGHPKSSLLLFPSGNVVNFINHSPDNNPNVKVQWSTVDSPAHRGKHWTNYTLNELYAQPYVGLLVDYVAIRDIYPGEEIYIDYGNAWENAWDKHEKSWKPPRNAKEYAPSYVMDDVAHIIRTREEQLTYPYSNNVLTTCFYKYSPTKQQQNKSDRTKTTTIQWKLSNGIYDFSNLYPCKILKRAEHKTTKDKTIHYYTVLIKNRPNKKDNIPKNHIVTLTPREAIRFKDKWYTTDQFLDNVFRHPIGALDDVWPKQWMDS